MFVVALMHIKAFPYDMYRVKVMSQAPLIHQLGKAERDGKGRAEAEERTARPEEEGE